MLHTDVETSLSAPFKLKVQTTRLTGEQFVHLCQENRDLRFELTAQKELVIMPPTRSESGWRSGEIFFALTVWAKKNGAGLSFDSSTGFTLPNGAIRSPAASWVRREQKRVHIYRPGQPVVSEDNPATLSGDPVLPTFVLDLRPLW